MMPKKKRRTSRKESEDWFPENKGKVRGWRRRFDQLDNYMPRYRNVYSQITDGWDYGSVRLPNPWFMLEKRSPSLSYKRKCISILLKLHDLWKDQLENSRQPYYLGLWLYDERFCDTQLVAGVGERIAHYNSVFSDAEVEKPPPAIFDNDLKAASMIKWRSCIDHKHYFQTDFDDGVWTEEVIAEVLRDVDERVLLENGDTMYLVRQGRLWVGQHE